MDRLTDFERGDVSGQLDGQDDHAVEAPPVIGTDERRMHVRAYNQWVSLLHGRSYPSVEDLELDNGNDFGPYSVLLDFTIAGESPQIAWLGEKLRAECDLPADVSSVAQVPARSLLSRLTDHHLQIIANRAPIGFEAEFVNARGNEAMYRGILMPFSSDDDTIDFVYGVINWKEIASPELAQAVEREMQASISHIAQRPMVPVWADGPSGSSRVNPAEPAVDDADNDDEIATALGEAESLADWLAAARLTADAALSADSRGRAALYRALGGAYDFALVAEKRPDEYAMLLEDSGIAVQARAPMTPVVKLIFGGDYDKTRLTEFAASLSFARRRQLPSGGMRLFLENFPGRAEGNRRGGATRTASCRQARQAGCHARSCQGLARTGRAGTCRERRVRHPGGTARRCRARRHHRRRARRQTFARSRT